MRKAASKALLGAIALVVFFPIITAAQQRNPVLVPPSQFGISPPVRDMELGERPGSQASFVKPLHSVPRPQHPLIVDPVVQSTFTTAVAPATSNNFPGLGNGFPGFSVNGAPSDANLAVGPNHIVQGVNTSFAVFSKTGSTIKGPVAFSTLFSGSSDCTRTYYSDPIILYDRQADRWVLSILGFDSTTTGPFYHCISVSTTGDPTGSYALYSFKSSTNLPDYPKMAVWPDAYYVTYNMYSGSTLLNAQVCAHDRAVMLAAQPEPTAQCFTTSSKYDVGLLPANLNGTTPPPAGAPNYLVSLGSAANTLSLWSFQVDWTTPANSAFTGPTSLAVAAFNDACTNGGTCIPQYGTSTQLDSLGDRVMYSLAYRNFGDHESLVTNHSVNAGSETGMRWYEIRSPGSNPIVYQQGTYAPDSNYRWMGSIAMDSAGDIGAGFSVSSSSIHPEIHYTGRLSTDPLGTLPQGEAAIVDGAGSQTTTICFPFIPCALTRWGDYTAMQVDPSDDCTFWYTNQYIPSNGAFNWSTQLASFKFPTCGANLVVSTTTLTAIPASTSTYGMSVQFSAAVSGSSGAPTGTVTFIDGNTNTSLGSQSLNSSGTATLSTSALAAGSHQITASYSGDSTYSGSSSSGLTYRVSLAGTTTTVTSSNLNSTQGQSVTFTATVTPATGGTPTGTVTFFDSSTSLGSVAVSGGVAKLSTSSLAAGSHAIAAQYNGDSNFTGSTSSSITQNVAATPQGFTISVSPSGASVRAGKTASFTVTVTASGGFTGPVTLSAAGIAPSPTFSPNPVSITSGSNSSKMNVTTTSNERGQTYTITVTGTSGSLSNSAPSPQVTVQVH